MDAIEIPLRNRAGEVVAHALIDGADSKLLEHRWFRSGRGYVMARIDGELVYLHRTILGLKKGDRRVSDHINGDPLDNRRVNLRACTQAENLQNFHGGLGRHSQTLGVSFRKDRGRWRAYGRRDGQFVHLGYFDTEDEAAEVAEAFRAKHMPFSQEARCQ